MVKERANLRTNTTRPMTEQRRKSTGDLSLARSNIKFNQRFSLQSPHSGLSSLSRPTTTVGNKYPTPSSPTVDIGLSREKPRKSTSKTIATLISSDKSLTKSQQDVLHSLRLAKKSMFDRGSTSLHVGTTIPAAGFVDQSKFSGSLSYSSPNLPQYYRQHHLKSAPTGEFSLTSVTGAQDEIQNSYVYNTTGVKADRSILQTASGDKSKKSGTKEVRFASNIVVPGRRSISDLIDPSLSVPSSFLHSGWKQTPLTEANLRKHIEESKRREVIGPMERIARWVASLPEKMEDPNRPISGSIRQKTLAAYVERQLNRNETGGNLTNPYLAYGISSRPSTVGDLKRDASIIVSNSGSSRDKVNTHLHRNINTAGAILGEGDTMFAPLFPPPSQQQQQQHVQKSLTSNSHPPGASQSNLRPSTTGHSTSINPDIPFEKTAFLSSYAAPKPKPISSSNNSDRGKLLCCLKVEIRTGVYRMLPVHQKDEPRALASTFCKANNLVGSIDALKDHISQAIKSYSPTN